MDAFAWTVIGSVAGVAGTVAAIVFGVIPLVRDRRKTAAPPAGQQPRPAVTGGQGARQTGTVVARERDRKDFFVSHARADRAWAEWVAWQLTEAGYTVELDVWDWAAGQNFITKMSDALDRCNRVVALFSAEYFDRSRYTTEEWSVAALHAPGGGEGRLVPVRVEDVSVGYMPAILRPLLFRDLFGLAEEQARQVLLEAVAGPKRPGLTPVFPGQGAAPRTQRTSERMPRLPGSIPRIWNVPPRNAGFTGREGLLVAVRKRLLAGERAVVQALHGIGGVGKTQLAIEYAHKFADGYDVAWWIAAEEAGLIGEQIAALGAKLGCVEAGAGIEAVRTSVLAELRQRGRWLLVFDNAEAPRDVVEWLPGGDGHVLITSRQRDWTEIAIAIEIDVFARAESVAILQQRVDNLSEAEADQLADQLGDLPLAIAQAAAFMTETGTAADDYLRLLESRAGQILSEGRPVSYPASLAAAIQLTVDQLARDDSAAAQIANLCAFLAPEPIPQDLFTDAPIELPDELADRVGDLLVWRQTLAHLGRQSLARIDQNELQIHRLTQAILRDRLSPAMASTVRGRTEAILAASNPGDPPNPVTWPRWARLMPHLLTADLAATSNPDLRRMACDACNYLLSRGDTRTGYDLASDLHQHWRDRLGDNDQHTLATATYLARALRILGRYAEARDLDQDTLDRKRRVLGEDHSDTLTSANGLALDLCELGDVEAARDLDQDTLHRRRRLLGDDHPHTLGSAANLANDLRQLGEVQAAHDLDQDTLHRKRRVLGEDHPSTLASAANLANDLRQLGAIQAAYELDRDILDRRRRVLGDDHPHTLGSAANLATDLAQMGEVQAAHDLDQDTLDRRRRVLGDDHPDTLASASNLATDRYILGETGTEQ